MTFMYEQKYLSNGHFFLLYRCQFFFKFSKTFRYKWGSISLTTQIISSEILCELFLYTFHITAKKIIEQCQITITANCHYCLWRKFLFKLSIISFAKWDVELFCWNQKSSRWMNDSSHKNCGPTKTNLLWTSPNGYIRVFDNKTNQTATIFFLFNLPPNRFLKFDVVLNCSIYSFNEMLFYQSFRESLYASLAFQFKTISNISLQTQWM